MKTLVNFRTLNGKTDSDSMIDPASQSVAELGCLVQYSGDDIGRPFYLESREVKIGRDGRADIQIIDEQTSREHAVVRVHPRFVEIEDLGSTNGTKVNDSYIEDSTVLSDGDILKVGSVHFKYFSPGDREKLYHDKLYRAATIDENTQVYNRRYFRTQLSLLSNRAFQTKDPLCLIIFDLDKFKSVNDTYDHLIGDFVLKQTAEVVQAVVRRNDVFARFGGEEFVIILPDTELGVACELASRIKNAVADKAVSFEFDGKKVHHHQTISLGVSELNIDDIDTDALLERADHLLCKAKNNGRNRVEF